MDSLDHKTKSVVDSIDRDLLAQFTSALLVTRDLGDQFVEHLTKTISEYKFDQYIGYPSHRKDAWVEYLIIRFRQFLDNDEWFFLHNPDDNIPHLVGCRVSAWDYDLFGVKMASISVLSCGDSDQTEKILSEILDGCLAVLRNQEIEFVSCRTNGDNIAALHILESRGFRYMENIIWPVASCKEISTVRNPDVRLMRTYDFDRVIDIANSAAFQRSHYHCDKRFNKKKADLVLAKYIETAWSNNEPIAVIESEGRVAGFFAFKIDQHLSETLGYKYGRMKNLAIDSRSQGRALGADLFSGTMSLIKAMGAEYIDSGYSTKNHISAKLHAKYGMYSVCEEATFHLWL